MTMTMNEDGQRPMSMIDAIHRLRRFRAEKSAMTAPKARLGKVALPKKEFVKLLAAKRALDKAAKPVKPAPIGKQRRRHDAQAPR